MVSDLSESPRSYEKPLPEVSTLTKPFWDYCKKHELRMQYCSWCNSWIWYPKAWCPECGKHDAIQWRQLSGKGEIYSFTVIRQVIDNSSAFQADLPFAVGLIELEEGPRMYSNITGVKPDDLKIGDKVSLYFEDATLEIAFPKFRKD